MTKVLKNNTANDVLITDVGQTLTDSETFVIDPASYMLYANSSDVVTLLSDSTLTYNDGTNDLSLSDAINHLKGYSQALPTDTDGSPIQRIKTTKTGWHYQPQWLEITTAKYSGGFYNKDYEGNDLGFVTYKIYDNTDTEITSGANEGNAVKTIVDWEPTHDYEIIATKLFQNSIPTTDVRLWAIGLPDVPYAYGGSRIFAEGGINLKHLSTGNAADTDGRSSKMLSYDATNHTNKFRLVIKHDAGVQHTMAMLWEIYKE